MIREILDKIDDMRERVDKGVMWLGPVLVLFFVFMLTVMYGLVDSTETITTGEKPETPEMRLVAQAPVPGQQYPAPPQQIPNELVHNIVQFPVGIGSGQNGQMQLINNTALLQAPNQLAHHGVQFPAGIGNAQNGQMQLINNPTFSVGIGNGQNGQMQLINNPTFPVGIGNGQMQLINKPTFPMGVGNGQIQLIRQVQPGGPYLGLSLGDVPDLLARQLNILP
ncbi:MAG: hypothetical protein WCQ99_13370, partial [Pseudomonadota bacterium]